MEDRKSPRHAAGPEAGRLVRARGDVEMSGTQAAEPVQPAGRPEQAPAGPEVSASPPTRTERSGAAGARGAGQGCAGSARGGGRAGRAAHRRPKPLLPVRPPPSAPNGRAPARSPSARFGHVLIAHAGTVLKPEMRSCRLLCSAPPADSSCFTADRHVS